MTISGALHAIIIAAAFLAIAFHAEAPDMGAKFVSAPSILQGLF